MTFLAKYEGTFSKDSFKEATIISPKDIWIINKENVSKVLQIDAKNNLLILKHLAVGEGTGALPVGQWFVSITIGDKKPFEATLNVTNISGKAAKTFIVPEASAKNQEQALPVPVIKYATRDKNTIEVLFSVDDERVKNGYILFDIPNKDYYEDSGSLLDTDGKPVNGCRFFFVNGKTGQYVLRKNKDNKEWFDKAEKCYFVVSNVNRLVNPAEEHHRSISAAATIK